MGDKTIECPYCEKRAKLMDSVKVYGTSYGMMYACLPCKAWVGVHKGSDIPLGTPAQYPLRRARVSAHKHFDGLWSKAGERKSEYALLAKYLEIPVESCHIGEFDEYTCGKVVRYSKRRVREIQSQMSS